MVRHKERQTARAHGGVRVLGTCDYRQKFGLPTAGQRGTTLCHCFDCRTNRLADLEPLIKLAIKQAYEAKPGEVRHIQ